MGPLVVINYSEVQVHVGYGTVPLVRPPAAPGGGPHHCCTSPAPVKYSALDHQGPQKSHKFNLADAGVVGPDPDPVDP